MVAYLSKAQKNLESLSWFEIVQVPRDANIDADALARLASGIDEEGEGSVPIEVLTRPYVSRGDVGVVDETPPPSWMTPLVEFLKRGVDRVGVREVQCEAHGVAVDDLPLQVEEHQVVAAAPEVERPVGGDGQRVGLLHLPAVGGVHLHRAGQRRGDGGELVINCFVIDWICLVPPDRYILKNGLPK